MFEDDDEDFSFIDEDFFKDALLPAYPPCSTSNAEDTAKVNDVSNIINNNNDGSSSVKKTISKCDNAEENSSLKSPVNGQKNSRTASGNNNFELDDFFECFGEDDFDMERAQNTPPDTEFTYVHTYKQGDKISNEKKNTRVSPTKPDFKARIFETLQDNKHIARHAHTINDDVTENSSFGLPCTSSMEKKKRTFSGDTSVQSFESSIKKKEPIAGDQLQDTSVENTYENCFFTPSVKPAQLHIRKSASPGGPIIQKRKFPGPAGILPQLGSHSSNLTVQQLDEEEHKTSTSKDIVCSQSSADEFIRGPWRQMCEDLEQDQLNCTSPLSVFNIKWVLRRASLRGQASVRKIPFLAVMLHNIDTTHADATVVLKDSTGEMCGTIVSTVLEEYGHTLQPGSVLLLKDVTLLSPVGLKSLVGGREPTRRHYLNITLNTLLTIYTSVDSDNVLTAKVCEIDKKELYEMSSAHNANSAPRAIVEEEQEEEMPLENLEPKQKLFSNTLGSASFQYNVVHQNRYPNPVLNSPLQQRFRFNPPVNNSPRIPNLPGNRLQVGAGTPYSSPKSMMANLPTRPTNANGLTNPQRFSTSSLRQPVLDPTDPRPSQGSFTFSPSFRQPAPRQSAPGASQTSSTFSSLFRAPHPRPSVQTSNFTPLFKHPISKIPTVSSSFRQPASQVSSSQTESSSSVFISQQEEKEVNNLLEDVDVDSLFGEF